MREAQPDHDPGNPCGILFCDRRYMKRKILITLVVLAAGVVALLGYDRAAEMDQNTMGFLHFHAPKIVSSALSSLGMEQVGIIVMVVAIVVAWIAFRGKDADTM